MKQQRNKTLIPYLSDLLEDGIQDISNGFSYLINFGSPTHKINGGDNEPTTEDSLRITQSVLEEIYKEIGLLRAEYGGALGGNRDKRDG